MAAPTSGITWGSTVGGYGKLGIYVKFTDDSTTTTMTRKADIEVWFASKYSVSDASNTLYYNRRLTNNEASTAVRTDSIYISKDHDKGTGWHADNAVKLWTDSHTYTLGTSSSTIYLSAKLTNVDRVGGTMKVSKSFTVPALATYTVSYNVNGGTGTFNSQTKYHGKSLTLHANTPTRTGYSFQGWSTSKTATTATYAAGGTLPNTINANTTLYAVWRANTYTISFDANGGTGAPSNQMKTYGTALTLSSTVPTRTNYDFLGWSTSKTATTATYTAGGSFTSNAATKLYAVWKLAYEKPKITKVSVDRCAPKMVTTYTYTKTSTVLDQRLNDMLLVDTKTTTGEQVYTYSNNAGYSYYCIVNNVLYVVTRQEASGDSGDSDITYTYSKTNVVVGKRQNDIELESVNTTTGEQVYEYVNSGGVSSYYCMVGNVQYTVTMSSSLSQATDDNGNVIYEYSDEGKSASISFRVECWNPEDASETKTETISSIKVTWTGSNGETGSAESGKDFNITESGISVNTFEGSILIGNDELDLEAVYNIEMIVFDTTASNTVLVTLQGLKVAIDSLPRNRGVSFGKPAELEDHADFDFTIYPRKGFKNVPIKKYTDLNDLTTPNIYVSEDNANDTYVNCPVSSGTFKMEVSEGGIQGQIQQTITYTSKTDFKIYHRQFHSGAWPKDWTCIYSVAGKVLWAGNKYMLDAEKYPDHVIDLSKTPISQQPNGIVLIFARFNSDSDPYAWQSFFVPKLAAHGNPYKNILNGSGHTFILATNSFAAVGTKYLYISDKKITGNANNTAKGTSNGITYNNAAFTLRYVLGV